MELLRAAPNPTKQVPLGDLKLLACRGVEVCQVRDVCVGAYTAHIEAVGLTEAAKDQLAQGQDVLAAALLRSADEKLTQAQPRVIDCTNREAALRRRYRL